MGRIASEARASISQAQKSPHKAGHGHSVSAQHSLLTASCLNPLRDQRERATKLSSGSSHRVKGSQPLSGCKTVGVARRLDSLPFGNPDGRFPDDIDKILLICREEVATVTRLPGTHGLP